MSKLKRAYSIDISAGGDTLNDLIDALNDIIGKLEREGTRESICGGVSFGYSFELECDPTITHEKYFEAIEASRQ